MTRDDDIPAHILPRGRGDEPDWGVLRDLIGVELADWFMWMYAIQLADGEVVHIFKHYATRRTIHLGEDGRAFTYVDRDEDDFSSRDFAGHYREVSRGRAIALAFIGWREYKPRPDDLERQQDLLGEAIEVAEAGELMRWEPRKEAA